VVSKWHAQVQPRSIEDQGERCQMAGSVFRRNGRHHAQQDGQQMDRYRRFLVPTNRDPSPSSIMASGTATER
jgi:hypothetical protein